MTSSSHPEKVTILHACAEYCQKLDEAALDFICQEKIHDIYYGPDPKRNGYSQCIGESCLSVDGRIEPGDINVFKPNTISSLSLSLPILIRWRKKDFCFLIRSKSESYIQWIEAQNYIKQK